MNYSEKLDQLLYENQVFTPALDKKSEAYDVVHLSSDEIRLDSHVPDLEPVIRINGEVFAVRGDISFLSGKPKAGKSAIMACMAASALLPADNQEDTLRIRVLPADGQEVIIVDTEQPKANTKRMVSQICRIIGASKGPQPKNLRIFNFRSYTKAEKFQRVQALFRLYPNAHLWLIDGLADLIDDVNGATESGKIVDWFMMQASQLNTTIVLVIHENPGTDKMRGHLGSEAERKGGGIITIIKNREAGYHTIKSRILRNSPDFESVCFSWSEGRQFFVTDGLATVQVAAEKDKDERDLARRCFPEGTTAMRHAQLIQRLKDIRNVKDTAASKWLNRMLACAAIIKRDSEADYVLHQDLALVPLPSLGFQGGLALPTTPFAPLHSTPWAHKEKEE